MSRVLLLQKAHHTPAKSTWLVMWVAVLAFAIPSSQAADPGEEAQPAARRGRGFKALHDVCLCAWKYDNLRPTTLRAVAPLGGLLNPPQFPVVHLSPGSPDYRTFVGEMMYCNWFCLSRQRRLAELTKGGEPGAPQVRPCGTPKAQRGRRGNRRRDSARGERIGSCHCELWTGPAPGRGPTSTFAHYATQPGFEAGDDSQSVSSRPELRLSEASPDYKVIVAAMNHWEPKIPNAKARLEDLLDDRKSADSAAAALAAAAPNGKPPNKKLRRKMVVLPRCSRFTSN